MTKPCVLGLPAMKLLVLADDDSVRHNIQTERADLVVSCGDIYESIILQVAQSIQCPRILAVKGNHDSGEPFPPPIVDLHLTIHTVDGVRFGGFQGSWRYKPTACVAAPSRAGATSSRSSCGRSWAQMCFD